MASPLVQRYAHLCQMPLEEVEKVWRQVKVQANQEGYKNNWEKIVENFRYELGLEEKEGRLVYFDGTEAEIVSESPSFALIQVHDIGNAPENLKELLETSKGFMVVNFEHLTKDREGKEPVGYPYQRKRKDETTASVGVASAGAGSSTPAPSVVYKGEDYDLTDIKGKKATIKNRKNGKRRKVDLKEIFEIEDTLGEVKKIWSDLNPKLTESQKKKAFQLMLEVKGYPSVPSDIVEGYQGPENSSSDFTVEDSDWDVVMTPAEEGSSDIERSLPSLPPVEPREHAPEPDTKAGPPERPGGIEEEPEEEEEEEPEIREPDSEELQKMLKKVRSPKSGFNLKKAADDTEKAAMESKFPQKNSTLVESDKPLVAQPEEAKKVVRQRQFATWDHILGVE